MFNNIKCGLLLALLLLLVSVSSVCATDNNNDLDNSLSYINEKKYSKLLTLS